MVITDITLVPTGVSRNYEVQVTVRNQGSLAVTYGNNFHVTAYLNGNFNSPIITWGVQGSWFGVGQSRVLTGTYVFPSTGSNDVSAWADPWNVVSEEDETNNVFTQTVNISGSGDQVTTSQEEQTTEPRGPLPTPTLTP
jgi:subtilase family serine protease